MTKSGTNSFHGNGFEFVRDSRFNATGAFAPLGQDGQKLGDGLNRNVFGGTLGGPVVKDKLFFFAGYERQRARQVTPDNLAFVPTAAMLAGDFTAPASAACRTAGQLTLRAPFVNNRINPALFSPAAVKIATSGWLPTTTDPCGAVRYSVPINSDQVQYVVRVDYQLSANHSIFGRYIDTSEVSLPALEQTHNVLVIQAAFNPTRSRPSQTTAIGDTHVFGANTVNAIRGTYVRTGTRANQPPEQYFDAKSLGIPGVYTGYVPGTMAVAVHERVHLLRHQQRRGDRGHPDLFRRRTICRASGDGTSWPSVGTSRTRPTTGRISRDPTPPSRSPARRRVSRSRTFSPGRCPRSARSRRSSPGTTTWYIGVYGSDTWRATDRVTLNLGLRWEPYLGNNYEDGTISNFSLDNFRNGVKSTQFVNAPAGLLYPGDAGFPAGQHRIQQAVVESLAAPGRRVGCDAATAAWRCGPRTRSTTTFRARRPHRVPRTFRPSAAASA